jgi:putative N-acetylmannosamine-6-phosphate epimerase
MTIKYDQSTVNALFRFYTNKQDMKELIELLTLTDDRSEAVLIAKGKYQLPKSFLDAYKLGKTIGRYGG